MNVQNSLEEVIQNNHLRNLSDIIKNYNHIPYFIQNNKHFVNLAYAYNHLEAVEV